MNRKRSLPFLAGVLAAVMLVFAPSAAQASNSGQVILGSFNFGVGSATYTFPSGTLSESVVGSGHSYSTWRGVVEALGGICYGRIDLTQRDKNDTLLSRYEGPQQSGCAGFQLSRTYTNGTFLSNTAKACASFYLYGHYQNAACVAIV